MKDRIRLKTDDVVFVYNELNIVTKVDKLGTISLHQLTVNLEIDNRCSTFSIDSVDIKKLSKRQNTHYLKLF